MRWTLIFALMFASVSAHAEDLLPDERREIKRDALYGEALFHLHSGRYDLALAKNYALRKRNQSRYGRVLDLHEATAELGLGMSRKAEQTFNALMSKQKYSFVREETSAQAWFYMAKHFYQKGLWKSALRAMRKVSSAHIASNLKDEYHFYLATLELFAGNPKRADEHVLAIHPESEWATYAFLNVAVSYTERDIHISKVEAAFNKALSLVGNTRQPEHLADRINLMAGKFFYGTGRGRSAIRHLRNVNLESPYTPSALLTYGWALTEQWQYHDALQPWYMLKTAHSPLNQDVQETFIAIPHLLEKLNAKVLALGAFEFATEQYDLIHQQLENSAQRLNLGQFIEPILQQQTPGKWGSFEPVNLTLPQHPDRIYLKDVMNQGYFQGQLQTLRDLHVIGKQLRDALKEIDTFKQTVVTRKADLNDIKTSNALSEGREKLKQYQQRYRHLLRKIDRAFGAPDGSGLASEEEKQQLALFKDVKSKISKLGKSASPSYQKRLRRVEGVLKWSLAERYAERKKQVSSNLAVLENAIRTAKRQIALSHQAYKDAPNAYVGFDRKLKDLEQQHKDQLTKLNRVYEKQLAKVGGIVKKDIQKRQARVTNYALQARLAAARLYDETSNQHRVVEQGAMK